MASSPGRTMNGETSSPLPSSPSPTFNTIVVDEMQMELSSSDVPLHKTQMPPIIVPSSDIFGFNPPSTPFSATDFSATEHRPSRNQNGKRGQSSHSTARKRVHYQDSTRQPTPNTSASLILAARDLILKACTLTESRDEQGKLLDLLEIFREYTEKGKIQNTSRIIAHQVANLETATRKIETQAKALAKTTTNPASNQIPIIPMSGPPSYAATANNGAKKITSPQEWTVVGKPKPSKKDLSSKPRATKSGRLILVQSSTGRTTANFSPFAMRNAFNKAFLDKGVKDPVVATVAKSLGQNVVITTTREFSADFLLEKKSIWEHILPFESAQKDEPWHKVVLHSIPTADFNTPDGMNMIIDEIKTFNNNLSPIGIPYWLTSAEKRLNQRAGSVVVAFATPEEATRAIRNRLYVAGMSVRVERFYSTAPTTQCHNCQGFGHLDNYCKQNPICKLCGDKHATQQHFCNICKAKGVRCAHLVPKCANCSEPYTADHKSCEILLAIKDKATTTMSV
jgi:hypothetical protein